MTTENKTEAEKIAWMIVDKLRYPNMSGGLSGPATGEAINLFTQALLDFREKDVREAVRLLEIATQDGHFWHDQACAGKDMRLQCDCWVRDAAALVRKFKEGKEG